MNDIERLRERMLAFPEVTEETPFGPEVLVYKVAGKMFATLVPGTLWGSLCFRASPAVGKSLAFFAVTF